MRLSGIDRLLIISHVVHYDWDGQIYAYGPYTREIDVWADLFPQVMIASPCRKEPPPGDALSFSRSNIALLPQPETGGESLKAKVQQTLALPRLLFTLCRAMRQVNAIHVRCPGNLGLLGAFLAPLFCRHRVAKYAGQWGGYPGEALSYRGQRALLRSRWWNAPVTVYGQWPNQPPHVIPFFTSLLEKEHIWRAQKSLQRNFHFPLRVLYVGRLSVAKNVDALLSAVGCLKVLEIKVSVTLIGEGPQAQYLRKQCRDLDIEDQVDFTGGLPFDEVLAHYEQSDVLVLVSETEGWPKAIAEGMAFGLICIGSNRGLVPQMLGEGRGIVVPPRDVAALVEALEGIARRPSNYEPMRRSAAAWAQEYSLEGLRDAIAALLTREWGVRIGAQKEGEDLKPNDSEPAK